MPTGSSLSLLLTRGNIHSTTNEYNMIRALLDGDLGGDGTSLIPHKSLLNNGLCTMSVIPRSFNFHSVPMPPPLGRALRVAQWYVIAIPYLARVISFTHCIVTDWSRAMYPTGFPFVRPRTALLCASRFIPYGLFSIRMTSTVISLLEALPFNLSYTSNRHIRSWMCLWACPYQGIFAFTSRRPNRWTIQERSGS